MLFDTHAHLDDKRFNEDRDKLIQELPERGVSRVLNPGADIETSRAALDLAEKHQTIYAGVGVHPHEVNQLEDGYLDILSDLASHEKVVAIGEIGLDYYYEHSPREIQKVCFVEQIELSAKLGLPIIIHSRDAHGDMLDILKANQGLIIGGVMHSYSGSWEMAEILLDMGFYLSLGGPVTFKNAKKPLEIAEKIPMDRLLIETDSPYLTPVPHRGKRNDPSLVRLVAERIAQIRGISFEELAQITADNGKTLFHI